MKAKLLKEIQQMTCFNDHTGALLLAATTLGCNKLAEQLEGIQREQSRLGNLPPNLYQDRYEIYTELMAFAKRNMLAASYEQLYAAF